MKATYDKGWLAKELAILPILSREELLQRWHQLFKSNPPFKISKELLLMSVAYRMQENVYGRLNPSTRRYLMNVAAELRQGKQGIAPAARLKSGTRLIREWQGKIHEVTILEEGVLFNGKQYRSLSEVARMITGTQWSGPAFFGLKTKGKKAV